MTLSKKRQDLILVIYDKVVIGLLVAAVSAVLIYSYNLYSKAFDAAQTQAGGYLATSSKLRDLVIDNSTQASQKIQFAFSHGEHDISQQDVDSIDSLAIQIRGIATLLGKKLNKTAAIGEELANALVGDATNFVLPDSITKKAVDGANAKIVGLQQQFIDDYDTEIGSIATTEFQKFFQTFEAQLPFYLQPFCLLVSVVVIFCLGTGLAWAFLGAETPPDVLG